MATYTLTHSSIACLMTATSDPNTLAEPVELMYMRPGFIAALPGESLKHSPTAWNAPLSIEV